MSAAVLAINRNPDDPLVRARAAHNCALRGNEQSWKRYTSRSKLSDIGAA